MQHTTQRHYTTPCLSEAACLLRHLKNKKEQMHFCLCKENTQALHGEISDRQPITGRLFRLWVSQFVLLKRHPILLVVSKLWHGKCFGKTAELGKFYLKQMVGRYTTLFPSLNSLACKLIRRRVRQVRKTSETFRMISVIYVWFRSSTCDQCDRSPAWRGQETEHWT